MGHRRFEERRENTRGILTIPPLELVAKHRRELTHEQVTGHKSHSSHVNDRSPTVWRKKKESRHATLSTPGVGGQQRVNKQNLQQGVNAKMTAFVTDNVANA